MTTEYRKPLPEPVNRIPTKPFWDGLKRHELVLPRCKKCDHLFYYPRELCPNCLASDLEWQRVSGKGRLYSYTVIHQPGHPSFLPDVPFVHACIQLDEGPRMVSNLVDCRPQDAKVDMRVEIVFDDVTPEWTLAKFRPVPE